MEPFVFTLPVKIIFGSGTLETFEEEIPAKCSKIAIITGKNHFQNSELKSRIEKMLINRKIEYKFFHEATVNPDCQLVDRLAEKIRVEKFDVIAGVGGGSALDCAKAVSMMMKAPENEKLYNYIAEWEEDVLEFPGRIPLILIPTTAATGSEANCGMVFHDDEEKYKITYFHPGIYGDVSIIDPELTSSLSMEQTKLGLFDAFCHIYESYITGTGISPVTDGICESLLKRLIEIFYEIKENGMDIQKREEISYISMLGLSGIPDAGLSGVYPLHDLASPLAARFKLSHASSLAHLFLPVAKFISSHLKTEMKMYKLGKILFGEEIEFMDGIDKFIKELDIKEEIKNNDEGIIEKMAFDGITIFGGGEMFVEAPKPLYISDIEEIYSKVVK